MVLKSNEHNLKPIFTLSQHEYINSRSKITIPIEFTSFIRDSLNSSGLVDVNFIDISFLYNQFDTVNHYSHIEALDLISIGELLLSWFRSYFTDGRQYFTNYSYPSLYIN